MRQIVPLLIFLAAVFGCKSSKKTANPKPISVIVAAAEETAETNEEIPEEIPETENELAVNIISTALSYHGTRYKYGGTTKKGMDCSGLIFISFKEHDIPLERTSSMMASQGIEIKLNEVKKGDLLFFTTGKNKRRINHVGLVVDVEKDDIRFIHSTTSRGVLVSSIKEGYWNYAFREARRIL
ncbi:C40 family peptidase [Flavobacteriaceae bacterium M23B6Z8]